MLSQSFSSNTIIPFQIHTMKLTFALAAALATRSVWAANHTVVVGQDANGVAGLVFTPDVVNAAQGDLINFEFRAGNHVTFFVLFLTTLF